MDFSSMSKLIDSIDIIFLISNIKLANPAIFLSNWTEISSCYNTLNWLILPVNWVEVFELINNSLNLILLYCKLVNKLKI